MSEQTSLPGLDRGWSVWQTLEAIITKEGQPFQRGEFTYTVERIDDVTVELHTYRVVEQIGDMGAGIRGFVLLRYGLDADDNLAFFAVPFAIVPPGDGDHYDHESMKGIPVVVETGFKDIEGALDALEKLLLDDDYAEKTDPLDWQLGQTTHGPALGWNW